MQRLDDITAPIQQELLDFEIHFQNAMHADVALLDKVTSYIVKRKGKQLRPMFVFLSAKMLGEIGPITFDATTLVELLHTATLVHDDVVDDAAERRGFFSVNALWKNKIAVLVGDYLLSQGLLLAIDNGEFQMLQIVSKAVKEMSEGELLQMEKARTLNMDEGVYYEIIRGKTATLIAACCAAGAATVTKDQDQIDAMHEFGINVGIAFQIKDDLFDYGYGQDIGKPVGIDIKEKKTTLPLIYALNKTSWLKKRQMINIVKNHNTNRKKVDELFAFVKEQGGIAYAEKVMLEYTQKAKDILIKMPDNAARAGLIQMVDYTITRKK